MKNKFSLSIIFFLLCFVVQAQDTPPTITLSANFANSNNSTRILNNNIDTFNRIHPISGFRTPIIARSGVCVVRPLGGIAATNDRGVRFADLSQDSYRWDPDSNSFVTDFSRLEEQIDNVQSRGLIIRMIVLDNPSWDFQRQADGTFPSNQPDTDEDGNPDYIINSFGNATPPVDNNAWAQYIRDVMNFIVRKLGREAAANIQYGIGREIGTAGHWTGTSNEFFRFYRRSVESIRTVLPNARVGSHFLWQSSNNPWARDFIAFCARENVPYNFVGVSYYPFYNRANRTNFDEVYRVDFGAITSDPNWDSSADLQIHEFALIERLTNGGAGFDSPPEEHLNSFLVGLTRMAWTNNINEIYLWGTGSQYTHAFNELRGLVGNRLYTNANSGDTPNNTFVDATFTQDESNDMFQVMAYNYTSNTTVNSGRGNDVNVNIRATVDAPPGSTFRWRTRSFIAGTGDNASTVEESSFRTGTTTGNGNNSLISLTTLVPGYSWTLYEFEITNQASSTEPSSSDNSLTGTWFRIRNRFTNNYLDAGSGFSLRTEASSVGFDKQFRFVQSGDFFNIDVRRNTPNDSNGILQAIDNSNSNVTVTRVNPVSSNTEMQWDITVNSNGIATFRNRAQNAFLRDSGGTATHDTTNDTNHTRWTLERVGSVSKNIGTLGKADVKDTQKIFALPNPSESGIFNLSQAESWSVSNLNGQIVLKGQGSIIDLSSKQRGIYILKTSLNQIIKLVY